MSIHGFVKNPKKSAYSIEYYDSSWERDYIKELESDESVKKWTKNHGIRIPYFDDDTKYKQYNPDFLVERTDGTLELIEMKSTVMLKTPNVKRKADYAKKWCDARNIKYRLVSRYQ